jgi:hypothetical protein
MTTTLLQQALNALETEQDGSPGHHPILCREIRAHAILTDENAALRAELAKHQESKFHPDWSMLVATQESLREYQQIIVALREQLALAESVRAAQVAGLVEGAEMLRQDVERYRWLREKCPWTMAVDGDDESIGTVSLHIKVSKDLIVLEGQDSFDAAIDAALKGEAG